MFGKGIRLFSILGFEIRVDWSWLIILVLVVWSLARGVFPTEVPGYGEGTYFLMGVLGAAGLFGSIIFHELCHSLVARRFDLPIRSITLFVFGGVSEMTDEPQSAKAEFYMAVAGPLSSAFLGAVFFLIALAGGREGWPPTVDATLRWLGFINFILAIFNLVPGFPLDGGRVFRSILWYARGNLRWATRVASATGSTIGLGLMGLGFVSVFVFSALGGLWWILIGLFLQGAAKQSYKQLLVREALSGEPVNRHMNPDVVAVPPDTTVESLVKDYIYRYRQSMFPVAADGSLAGCVTTGDVRKVPDFERNSKTVRDIVTQCPPQVIVGPDEDAYKALSLMSRSELPSLFVVEGDRLLGMVSLSDLLKFLSLKMEIEGPKAATFGDPPAD